MQVGGAGGQAGNAGAGGTSTQVGGAGGQAGSAGAGGGAQVGGAGGQSGKAGAGGGAGTTASGGAGMSRDAASDAPADAQGFDAATCGAANGVSVSPVIIFGSLSTGESQQLPAIAFDGTNYLVVWQQGVNSIWKLYGSRISQDGVLLDASPFLISSSIATSATAAFNGTDFDVIWSVDASPFPIYGARVTTSGTVRDPAGVVIEPNQAVRPAIACGAGGCLVVWQYSNSHVGIYGTRLDGALTALDSPRILLPLPADCTPDPPDGGKPCSDAPADPNVVSTGSDYFVSWTIGNVQGTRVSAAGAVSGAPVTIGGPSPFRTGLAFGGTELFVSWVSGFGTSSSGFAGSRVTGTSVLDSPSLPLASATISDGPATTFDGVHFITIWTGVTGHLLTGTRVTTAGALVDSPGFAIDPGAASYAEAPAIASSGQRSSLAAYVTCNTTSGAPNCRVFAHILQNCR